MPGIEHWTQNLQFSVLSMQLQSQRSIAWINGWAIQSFIRNQSKIVLQKCIQDIDFPLKIRVWDGSQGSDPASAEFPGDP